MGNCAFVFAFAWLFSFLLVHGILASFMIGIATGVLAAGFSVYYPIMKRKNAALLVEKELPFALLSMAVELNLNVPFEKALQGIGKGNYGKASEEFGIVVDEIKQRGSSVQEALLHFSERFVDSLQLKRCISQLVSIYEQGGRKNKGLPVKKLAREILAGQRAESKEFSGKLVVFSLMFIAVSAIVPALFQSYIIVGSMFLEANITPFQALIIVVAGFPLLDATVLLFVKSKTPVFLRE